jgi:hypothetical protein
MSFSASCCVMTRRASPTLSRRVTWRGGNMFPSAPGMSMPTSSMPPGEKTCMKGVCFSSTWTSISRTSRPPARSFSRIFSRDCSPRSGSSVALLEGRRGRSMSSSRSSASSSAFFWTFASSSVLTMLTETSTRSRTIDSTSRPT